MAEHFSSVVALAQTPLALSRNSADESVLLRCAAEPEVHEHLAGARGVALSLVGAVPRPPNPKLNPKVRDSVPAPDQALGRD
jgi:hypothetical protein